MGRVEHLGPFATPRVWPRLFAAVALFLSGGPLRAGEPICLPALGRSTAASLVLDSLRLLRAAGYDPGRYRLELREPDPFAREPRAAKEPPSVLFWPRDPARDPALRVDEAEPCAVSWNAEGGSLTAWQRHVLERAWRAGAPAAGPEPPDWTELRIAETAELVGVRFRRADGSEGHVLLPKAEVGTPEAATPSD